MKINRRQLLQAIGLTGLSSMICRSPDAFADGVSFPSRIIFFVQPHGHLPTAWNMAIPGAPMDSFAERSLSGLAPSDFGEALRPLHPYRDRLLIVEGLAHTSVLADIAEIQRTGGDLNNHNVSVAQLLTGSRALQRSGIPCTGGARSIDQELALRTIAPGRFGSRVYGNDYVPNQIVAPFSFLGSGQATPIVSDPAAAFSDLLGYKAQVPGGAATTRDEAIARMRTSVLDAAGSEYDALAPKLGAEGRQKLEEHRNLIRELEVGIGIGAKCDAKFDGTGNSMTQFMKLIRLAFSCDLTRVATFAAPVPLTPEFGYPAEATVHAYAHASIEGRTSCGDTYSPIAARAMTDLGTWYANHFALLLSELDSVQEGNGTMLDYTTVVWMTELATPTHEHHDVFTLVAGGGNGFFNTGRYVRYPRTFTNPLVNFPKLGPAQNRFLVSLMQSMGQTDTSFGMTSAQGSDGSSIPMTGALTELHK